MSHVGRLVETSFKGLKLQSELNYTSCNMNNIYLLLFGTIYRINGTIYVGILFLCVQQCG